MSSKSLPRPHFVHRLGLTALFAGFAGLAAAPFASGAELPTADPVAEVDGKAISRAELESAAAPHLAPLEAQRRDILEAVLDQLLEKRLFEAEAARRGISLEAFLNAEVETKTTPTTEAEIQRIYNENRDRAGGRSIEELRGQITQYLMEAQRGDIRRQLALSLRKEHKVRIHLEVPRVAVEVADAPTRGAATAPITIVAWSDFQCPFCGRVVPTIKQLEEKYGDRVRIAFRQYPASFHPQAQKAAEASLCARAQGKFWEMHDALFANQSELAVDQLKAKAAGLGLDAAQFDRCLDGGEMAAQVKADFEAGQKAGVDKLGTPAIFVNGRALRGAVPFEEMAAVVDDELARQGS